MTSGLDIAPKASWSGVKIEHALTAEAALSFAQQDDMRVDPLVEEGATVAQGAPILKLRRHPEMVITAPVGGRVGHLELGPGHRLSRVAIFHEEDAGRHRHDSAPSASSPQDIRQALLGSGLWRQLRSRPYGRIPRTDETPAAIFVMALDTRPYAPDPRQAIAGSETAFERGLHALRQLASEKLVLCQDRGPAMAEPSESLDITVIRSKPVHPWGLAGFQIHEHFPANPARAVWDIAAEDVAAIGELLETGYLRETRLVGVAGSGLREPRLVRCQPWADLRGLSRGHLKPGQHSILSGSPLEGRPSRWLHERDRQVSVLDPAETPHRGHWFLSALRRASRPLPLIPSASVDQALGGAFPALSLLRAISAGDREGAVRLGALSLLDEDLSLADYVTCAEPRLSDLLHAMLRDIAAEEAA